MFIEKIDGSLLEEIKKAFYDEHKNLTACWDEEIFKLGDEYYIEEFEHSLRSEIYQHYLDIPTDMLLNLIHEYFPFLKQKNIGIAPFSNISISDYDDDYKEVTLEVYADIFKLDREELSPAEEIQVDTLLRELTEFYSDLGIDTTFHFRYLPFNEVPYNYLDDDDKNRDDGDVAKSDFIKITFFEVL